MRGEVWRGVYCGDWGARYGIIGVRKGEWSMTVVGIEECSEVGGIRCGGVGV
jgi:hypothetical protein